MLPETPLSSGALNMRGKDRRILFFLGGITGKPGRNYQPEKEAKIPITIL
jgi:hypothetical protein